jgi:hypothetical protein
MNLIDEIMFFSIQNEMVALSFVFYVLILSTMYSFKRNIFVCIRKYLHIRFGIDLRKLQNSAKNLDLA